MAFVVSKLSSDVEYSFYATFAEKNFVRNHVKKTILIKGGAGVVNSRTLIAPDGKGVFTEVSDEEIEMLKTHPVFKKHEARGFVAVVASEKSNVGETEMQQEDDGAQLTAEDFADEAAAVENEGSELKIGDKKVNSKGRKSSAKKRGK